jgi:radical SAM protein with 4Fe4S-binding SPASM domain
MANILLTEKCVRSCPYCFAKEHMEGSALSGLSWDNLIYIADFLEISGHRKVSLLGGEPTLHPQFVDFTTYLIERKFHVNIFTSGIMSNEKLLESQRDLSGFTLEKLSFTCNFNHPDISTKDETERIHKFLSAFGHLTTLGFNIYKTEFDFEFLIQTINNFNLRRHIRIGLAHPIPGEVNTYIPAEEVKKIVRKFTSFFDLFERFKISPGFDCGMPMCIFTDEELGRLLQLNKGSLSFGCGPAIDIGPDMKVWSCFPLSNIHKRSLYEFNSMQEIDSFYKELHDKIRSEIGGIFEDCDNCTHRFNDLCRGGCIAHSLIQFNNEAPVRKKEIYT